MKFRFLHILMIMLFLAGCAPVGTSGQTTVIVVTATPPPQATQAMQPSITAAPALQNTPMASPTSSLAPGNASSPFPTSVPTNLPAATPQANTLPTSPLPVTGMANPVSIDQLLDYQVMNANGNQLGEVKDFVVNRTTPGSASGEIPYLLVESSLKNDWYIPVPWGKVQLHPNSMAIVLPVNAAQLANAPSFNKDVWPASFAAQQTIIQNFWANPGAVTAPLSPLTQPGSMAQNTDYIRGDDLLGVKFLTPQGVKLGEIKDLAIDWQKSQPGSAQTAQFGYALLQLDDNISPTKPMVPIPWRMVNIPSGQEDIMVNLSPNQLQLAPNFAKGAVPDLYSEPLQSQLNTYWSGK